MLKISRMLNGAGHAVRAAGITTAFLLTVLLSACGSGGSDADLNVGGGGVETPEQPSDKKPVQLHCAP